MERIIDPEDAKKTASGYGFNVTGLMRDYLTLFVPYETALAMSQEFDEQITEADWLETYNGTTFNKT